MSFPTGFTYNKITEKSPFLTLFDHYLQFLDGFKLKMTVFYSLDKTRLFLRTNFKIDRSVCF
jgi:hypothetical protein